MFLILTAAFVSAFLVAHPPMLADFANTTGHFLASYISSAIRR